MAKKERGQGPRARVKAQTAYMVELIGPGLSPLDYVVATMRDTALDHEIRIAAAKAALPYCTKKQPIAIQVDSTLPMRVKIEGPEFPD